MRKRRKKAILFLISPMDLFFKKGFPRVFELPLSLVEKRPKTRQTTKKVPTTWSIACGGCGTVACGDLCFVLCADMMCICICIGSAGICGICIYAHDM
jgi:hypothetical protein